MVADAYARGRLPHESCGRQRKGFRAYAEAWRLAGDPRQGIHSAWKRTCGSTTRPANHLTRVYTPPWSIARSALASGGYIGTAADGSNVSTDTCVSGSRKRSNRRLSNWRALPQRHRPRPRRRFHAHRLRRLNPAERANTCKSGLPIWEPTLGISSPGNGPRTSPSRCWKRRRWRRTNSDFLFPRSSCRRGHAARIAEHGRCAFKPASRKPRQKEIHLVLPIRGPEPPTVAQSAP